MLAWPRKVIETARQRRNGAGIAGEVRPDVEHGDAAVIRSGHGRG
jgi:hypothetical protein